MDAVMLYNGQLVYVSDVSSGEQFDPFDSNLIYFNDLWASQWGRIKRFRKNNTAYMAIFNSISGDFVGYFKEENFWDSNNGITKNKMSTTASIRSLGIRYTSPLYSFPMPVSTKVYFGNKYILREENLFRLRVEYGYDYLENITQDSSFETIPSQNILFSDQFVHNQINIYGNYILNKRYLRPNGTISSLDSAEEEILFDVIYIWNEIINDGNFINYLQTKELYEVFEAHWQLSTRYNDNFNEIEESYHILYTEEYFARLRLKLIEFRYWLLNFDSDYEDIDENDLIVYIVNIFPVNELSYLSYDTKINLLNKILKNNFWVIGDWYFNSLNDEEAIIKIVSSIRHVDQNDNINFDEINSFIDFLNEIYDNSHKKTLYEVLYKKLDDSPFLADDGKGNLGKLVKQIYALWLLSKYNPFHMDPSIADNALNYFTYTNYTTVTAQPPDEDPFTAAPILLGYDSEKILLWYQDNFKFEFDSNQIVAKEDIPDYGYVPIGIYNFFQPVALKGGNNLETIIQIPFQGSVTQDNVQQNLDKINNCIPIFYLKYVDDLGDYSDAKETIGTILDVVLTFTGIGNLSKLKHLRHVSKLRRLSTLGATERILMLEGISGIIGLVEITAGIASTVVSYVEDQCTDPELCERLNFWLFVLEMASLSFDAATKRALRNQSKKVVDYIGSSPWPNSFEVPHTPGDPDSTVRKMLENLSNIEQFINEFRTSRLLSKPDLLAKFDALPESKKYLFFYDFDHQADDVLDALRNNNGALFNTWESSDEIVDLVKHKRKIEFLEAYKRFNDKPHEVEHITLLHNGKVPPGFDPIGGHSHTNIVSGDILDPNTVGLPSNMESNITHAENGHITYSPMFFKKPAGATGGVEYPVGSGILYGRKKIQTIWNPNWSDQRIKEEMSYAFSQKKIKVPSTIVTGTNNKYQVVYKSFLTDGTNIEIIMRNFDDYLGVTYPDHLSIFKLNLKKI